MIKQMSASMTASSASFQCRIESPKYIPHPKDIRPPQKNGNKKQ